VPEGFTLYSLAETIVDAFNFYFDHCFGFYDNTKRWTNSIECYELFKDIEKEQMLEPSRCQSVKRTKVNKVFDSISKRMLFLFDYGDNWHFIVKLTKIEPPQDIKYPIIVKSVGEAPPQYPEIDEEEVF